MNSQHSFHGRDSFSQRVWVSIREKRRKPMSSVPFILTLTLCRFLWTILFLSQLRVVGLGKSARCSLRVHGSFSDSLLLLLLHVVCFPIAIGHSLLPKAFSYSKQSLSPLTRENDVLRPFSCLLLKVFSHNSNNKS